MHTSICGSRAQNFQKLPGQSSPQLGRRISGLARRCSGVQLSTRRAPRTNTDTTDVVCVEATCGVITRTGLSWQRRRPQEPRLAAVGGSVWGEVGCEATQSSRGDGTALCLDCGGGEL